jgi:ribosome-binding protein aMBF1 (putative translation factor)
MMASGRWEQIRERHLSAPGARERYEHVRNTVISIRQILQTIEAERERLGLTKAELAQEIGASPSAIRRLLTSETTNPTLRTVLELCDVLGIELRLRTSRGGRSARRQRPERVAATQTAV